TTFASGALPGLVLLAGLAWSSRRAAACALGGAALASAIEYAFGAPPASFAAGLCGFNGALAALAASALGARAAVCATMLAAVLHLAAVRLGLPVMTAPFAIAGWTVHGAWRLMAPEWSRSRREPATDEAPETGANAARSVPLADAGMLAATQAGAQNEGQIGSLTGAQIESPIGSLTGARIGAQPEAPIDAPTGTPIEPQSGQQARP
ncbi:MAG TPA: urea transporter, partial [Paraburkholderia sp.]|nr:urea transporter [Paraburkholderia sp.]